MKTALLSLQALMCSPEPNDPQDAVVATMYKERQTEFVSTAKLWTETHAKPSGGSGSQVELLSIQ
jgi:ubiquitin-conjugating enzyme (huntingtin interacting protein 2)